MQPHDTTISLEHKEHDAFSADRSAAERATRAAYMREWTRANKDRVNAERRERRRKDRERVLAREKEWRAAHHEQVLEYRKRDWYKNHEENLAKLRQRSKRHHSKPEVLQANRELYKKQKDEINERLRAFRARHPDRYRTTSVMNCQRRRARIAKAPYEKVNPMAIYTRDKGICGICGRKVARKDMSLDHLIPLSFGGSHLAVNLQLAHLQCNRRRNATGPAQLRLDL